MDEMMPGEAGHVPASVRQSRLFSSDSHHESTTLPLSSPIRMAESGPNGPAAAEGGTGGGGDVEDDEAQHEPFGPGQLGANSPSKGTERSSVFRDGWACQVCPV